VEFAGAFYHVIVRGNQRRDIFRDDRDRQTYLKRVEHYRSRYRFNIYAYCLMNNHVHILIETKEVGLSKVMQGIQFTYTQYYNRRYGSVGHLFQGRYKAILCDREAYLLGLVRYIHLNPVRLKHPHDPWRYRWSSHRGYLGEKIPVGVETSGVLGEFGRVLSKARQQYMSFMKEGLGQGHQESYYETVDQRFLGDERFIEEVESKTEGRGDIEARGPRVTLRRLVEGVAAERKIDQKALVNAGRQRQWVRARGMLVYLARGWCGVSAKELGRFLHRDPSMVSRLYAQYASHRDPAAEARLVRSLKERQ